MVAPANVGTGSLKSPYRRLTLVKDRELNAGHYGYWQCFIAANFKAVVLS
jgi:hypothetical protein